jgi:hypothetical protein
MVFNLMHLFSCFLQNSNLVASFLLEFLDSLIDPNIYKDLAPCAGIKMFITIYSKNMIREQRQASMPGTSLGDLIFSFELKTAP